MDLFSRRVAKLAGHTVAVCEKYYARLDMAVKAKELTEFEFGRKGSKDQDVQLYLWKTKLVVTNPTDQIFTISTPYPLTESRSSPTISSYTLLV